MLGVGKVTVAGFVEQVGEEQFRRHVFPLQLALFGRFEQVFLRLLVEVGKYLARVLAGDIAIKGLDAHAQDVAQRQLALVAELGRDLQVRALHVPDVASRVRGLHVTVEEFEHARFDAAGAVFVVRDQAIDRRTEEAPFVGVEERRLVVVRFAFGRDGVGRVGRLQGAHGAGSTGHTHRYEHHALDQTTPRPRLVVVRHLLSPCEISGGTRAARLPSITDSIDG